MHPLEDASQHIDKSLEAQAFVHSKTLPLLLDIGAIVKFGIADPASTMPTSGDIAKARKIDLPVIEGTVEDLVTQNYLKREAHFAGSPSAFSITPTGQNELSRLNTTNFSPTQVNQTFNNVVGAVQTGQGNVANVTQHIGASLTEVTSLLGQLRASLSELPPEKQEEAADVLEMLQEEVETDKLDQKKVNRAMKFLQRVSRGIGNSTKWAISLITLITKLQEIGVPIDQIPDLFS